jgi:two-component system, sensor histidine kinase and response regulator
MSQEAVSSDCVLDLEGTMQRLGGDRELFCDLVGFFFDDAPLLLEDVRSAAQAEDGTAMRSAAHALKGLVSGCGGIRAAQVAQQVESAGQNGEFNDIQSLVDSLSSEFNRLCEALRPHHPQGRPGTPR